MLNMASGRDTMISSESLGTAMESRPREKVGGLSLRCE